MTLWYKKLLGIVVIPFTHRKFLQQQILPFWLLEVANLHFFHMVELQATQEAELKEAYSDEEQKML